MSGHKISKISQFYILVNNSNVILTLFAFRILYKEQLQETLMKMSNSSQRWKVTENLHFLFLLV